MIAIERVDIESFDHPAEYLGISWLALVVEPGCIFSL
tara:strand:+ start:1935 stop:2045 length:111 start_codon:yes stop_codon:yes gene_type:complete